MNVAGTTPATAGTTILSPSNTQSTGQPALNLPNNGQFLSLAAHPSLSNDASWLAQLPASYQQQVLGIPDAQIASMKQAGTWLSFQKQINAKIGTDMAPTQVQVIKDTILGLPNTSIVADIRQRNDAGVRAVLASQDVKSAAYALGAEIAAKVGGKADEIQTSIVLDTVAIAQIQNDFKAGDPLKASLESSQLVSLKLVDAIAAKYHVTLPVGDTLALAGAIAGSYGTGFVMGP
jgi:hypothetical protein